MPEEDRFERRTGRPPLRGGAVGRHQTQADSKILRRGNCLPTNLQFLRGGGGGGEIGEKERRKWN